jgi:hypothetical protein
MGERLNKKNYLIVLFLSVFSRAWVAGAPD